MAELFTLVGKISIDATLANQTIDGTMNLVGQLNNTLQGTASQADSASKSLGKNSKLGAASVWLGNMATSMTHKLLNMAKTGIKTGMDYNATMDRYKIIFASYMDNNKQAADEFMETLMQMSIDSPLNLEGLAEGSKELLGVGLTAKETLEILEMLGDVSLGDNENFATMAHAVMQIFADNRLMAKELNQLSNAGFAVWKLLPEYLGVDMATFTDNVKKGMYSPDVFVDFLRDITSEGGLFFNKADAMMESYTEQMEKFDESKDRALGSFLRPFYEIARDSVLPRMSGLLEEFYYWAEENQGSIKKLADTIGNFVVTGLDALLNGFKWLSEHGDEVVGYFQMFGNAVAELFGGNKGAGSNSVFNEADQELRDAVQSYWFLSKEAEESDSMYQLRKIRAKTRVNDAYAALQTAAMSSNLAELEAGLGTDIETYLNDVYNDLNIIFGAKLDEDAANKVQSDFETATSGLNLKVLYTVQPVFGSFTGGGSPWTMAGNAVKGLVNLFSGGSEDAPSHAKGLDFVPRDGYLARLHYGEAVLNRSTADMLRNGGGIGNTGRVEALLQDVLTGIRQIAGNTSAGQTLALDTGVLVGQITPMIDKRLGTISNRKGRG